MHLRGIERDEVDVGKSAEEEEEKLFFRSFSQVHNFRTKWNFETF